MIALIIIFSIALLSAVMCIAEGLAEGKAEMENQKEEDLNEGDK